MGRILVVVLIVMCLGTRGWSEIIPPQNMPQGSQVSCSQPTRGYTRTVNTTWVGLGGLQAYLNVLNSAPVKGQFTGNWNYVAGIGGVTGTLAISPYVPFDDDEHWRPDCSHGAQIRMSLSGLSGLAEGQEFQWMQYFTASGNSGSRQNTIDPPRTEAREDGLPFYYNRNEPQWRGTTFSDGPCTWMNDATAHGGGVSFVTFLSSWDGTDPTGNDPETVSIYGAVTWGYNYACVPEPSTLVIFSGLGVVVLVMGWRRRKQTVWADTSLL